VCVCVCVCVCGPAFVNLRRGVTIITWMLAAQRHGALAVMGASVFEKSRGSALSITSFFFLSLSPLLFFSFAIPHSLPFQSLQHPSLSFYPFFSSHGVLFFFPSFQLYGVWILEDLYARLCYTVFEFCMLLVSDLPSIFPKNHYIHLDPP